MLASISHQAQKLFDENCRFGLREAGPQARLDVCSTASQQRGKVVNLAPCRQRLLFHRVAAGGRNLRAQRGLGPTGYGRHVDMRVVGRLARRAPI